MPKQIDHDARRRDIAKAAAAVISAQGIDNTRLVDVARAAAATTGAITHYFEGKDAVMLAALDHVAQKILKQLRAPHEGEPNVEKLVERASLVLPLDEEGMSDWRVWLAFFGRAAGDPSLARVNNAYYDEFRQGIAHVLRELQKSGMLRSDVDPDMAANSIITAVDGLGVRATLDPDRWPAERQKDLLRATLLPLLPTT
jgi:TetR/AcrR family transcriptional repressor of bet genes